MSRYAPTIHTDPAAIAALEALLPQLPNLAHVELTLTDGSRVTGTVAIRPTVQQYRDADENEGTNGQVRLDPQAVGGEPHLIWLDRIAAVRQLPPVE